MLYSIWRDFGGYWKPWAGKINLGRGVVSLLAVVDTCDSVDAIQLFVNAQWPPVVPMVWEGLDAF